MPQIRRLMRCVVVISCVASLFSCSRQPDSDRVFIVRGVVRGPYEAGVISIAHEAIPNFMPAMTMPFRVEAGDVKDLTAGDRVEFEFRVGENSRATKFRRIGRVDGGLQATKMNETSRTAVRRLRAGDPVGPFSLVDQDNRPFTDEALKGMYTIVTFIFTRCPVPEFCPLLGKKFNTMLAQVPKLEEPPKPVVQFLSITLDPEYDRPEILREYGKSLNADFGRWRFATGDAATIESLARQFAVRAEKNGTSLDHTLATALIDPRGYVVEIWRGNAWKPEEILQRLRTAGAGQEAQPAGVGAR